MAFEHLRVSRDNAVGWLEYARPPRNAFDWAMLHELEPALRELLDADDVRVIVIASALDRYFSSGADLETFRQAGAEDVARWVEVCHAFVRTLRRSPKPLLAAIHGTAVGGGLEVTLHCDVRFVASDARLGQPEIHIGFVPPVGGTQGLARRLGRHQALRLLYEGALISADEAVRIGLADVVVPPDRLRPHLQAYAAALACKPAPVLAAIRRCVSAADEGAFEHGLRVEQEEATRLGAHPNFREGVSAFLEKRPPRWAR